MKMSIRHLTCGYRKHAVLRDFSCQIASGHMVAILGQNGVGKTTLFQTVLGHIPKISGDVFIDGKSYFDMGQKERAKNIAYVPQAQSAPFPFSVEDVVLLGRLPHFGVFSSPGAHDRSVADRVLRRLGIETLKGKRFTELSGGEQQMVLIARALAQEAHFIMMDEPTSNLDFGNQITVLTVLKNLASSGIGIVMVTHNPGFAFFCDADVIAITSDKEILTGQAGEVITRKNMKRIYGVSADPDCFGFRYGGKENEVQE